MPTWIPIAFIAGLTSNLGNFLFRYILNKGDDATSYAWFHEAFRLIFFFIIAVFSFRLDPSRTSFAILCGLGIAEFIAVYFFMKMHSNSHLSISTIITRTRLIWIPIIAFILFRETLEVTEYIGIAILFFGLSVTTSPKKIFTDKGVAYAYLSAITIAIVNISLKAATPYASIAVVMVFTALPSTIALPVFMKNGPQRIIHSLKINLPIKLVAGLINASSMYFLTLAIHLGPVSKVSAIYQSMMITSVLAGIIFLKETENAGKKIIGSIISIIGVVLLTT